MNSVKEIFVFQLGFIEDEVYPPEEHIVRLLKGERVGEVASVLDKRLITQKFGHPCLAFDGQFHSANACFDIIENKLHRNLSFVVGEKIAQSRKLVKHK